MTISLRPATAQDDFEAVAELYLATWRATYVGQVPAVYLAQLTPATWQPKKRWQRTVLAFDGRKVVGVCTFGPARPTKWQGCQEIYSLYVLLAYQHQRIGQRLIQAAIARLTEPMPVMLAVLASNHAARRFYEVQGFVAVGEPYLVPLPQGVTLTEQAYQLKK
ncbi:GNAT family N-acetyltransferase [Lactiplantibacillus nangangensis]|uniref:GNAT family N-acetyltransferase n=1 Tax=Lactiplantibacillus nangangensis TaxID=2559917 RepID=A0ABW1SIK9_9LACO|nr:GNAT family N-acetyltransferase [Lactiplantibacillus nangangensis]